MNSVELTIEKKKLAPLIKGTMDKEYFRTLTSDADRALYLRSVTKLRKREWDLSNQDKVFKYRRNTTLKRAYRLSAFPSTQSQQKYGFTEDELAPILKSIWSTRFPNSVGKVDTHC